MAFTLTAAFLLAAVVVGRVQAQAPTFTFDCNAASTVCDTHCFGVYCGGITGHGLHYDPQSGTRMPRQGSTTTTADFRRQAVGCVNSNPCGGGTFSCDEFPYASTYDGGLGCFPDGYTGGPTSDLFMQGVTHCVVATDNSAHGFLVQQFYTSQNIQDSQQFSIAIDNPTAFCTSAMAGTCPDQGVTNPQGDYYQARSAPDNTFCPERGIGTRALVPSTLVKNDTQPKVVKFTTADGKEHFSITGSPAVGDKVWSSTADMGVLNGTTEAVALDTSAFVLNEIVSVD